jgi:orotidine-5'-phosphate decarboxylase
MLYEHVAIQAATQWNANGNVGLVTGATQPMELSRIRDLAPGLPFLVPGIGAQGGDINATIRAGAGGMLLLSSSRAILYAGEGGEDYESRAREEAISTRDHINEVRKGLNIKT